MEPQAAKLSPRLQNTEFQQCFREEEQETAAGGCGMLICVPGLLSASMAVSGMCVISPGGMHRNTPPCRLVSCCCLQSDIRGR